MFSIFRKKREENPQLFYHTDIHCHLAPGIDDGQRNAAGGADLVEKEASWGINHIILTPHITQDVFENTPETISEAVGKLKDELDARGVDVRIDYSAEHRLDGYFMEQLEKGLIRPMPNDYLLVENSFVQEAWNLDQLIFELSLKGFRPILAHPERYWYYYEKPERYKQLHNAGTLFQVNILSLAGHYGKQEKKIAEMLIEENLVDFLGSDMHNHNHAEAIEKYLVSKDYKKHSARLMGRIMNDTAFKNTTTI